MTILDTLFLNGSSSVFKATRVTIKDWISLNFGQIPSTTIELTALEFLNNRCILFDHSSAFFFYWIFFILAGNKGSQKSWMCLKFGKINKGLWS